LAADTLRETGFLTKKTEGNVAKIILRTIEQRLEAGKKLRDKCPACIVRQGRSLS
jgi:hypothetical protein